VNEEQENLFSKNPHQIQANDFTLANWRKPPDKVTTTLILKYKSFIKTNFRDENYYEDNKSGKEKEKVTHSTEDENNFDIVNNNESIINYNNLLSTGKKEMTDEEKIKLKEKYRICLIQ
jgi:hypothetical protein